MNNDLLVAFEEHIGITKALDKSTVSSYIADIKQLHEHLGKELLHIDSEDILRFLSSFKNKRTLNRKLSAINSFLNFCHKYDFRHKKIKIPMAKIPKNLPKYLSLEQIMSGIELIDRKSLIGKRDYALILFLYASGCRISEALSASRNDIVDAWLKIRYAKGEKERMVPLAPVALDALKAYLVESDIRSEHIWLNYKGDMLSRVSAYKIVKKYLGVSPHVLRHSFASALIIGGADLRVVQELLGHSSLITTQIYTHIEQKELSETVNRYHPLRSKT
ncbi:MAG: tyrosine-type recombinase/integrase [Sulfurovum sp.]|nr:tyrosine-type recombinase/integrase [Sulfurovum sp.]